MNKRESMSTNIHFLSFLSILFLKKRILEVLPRITTLYDAEQLYQLSKDQNLLSPSSVATNIYNSLISLYGKYGKVFHSFIHFIKNVI